MNVGVMKNYKLRDLRASHTLQHWTICVFFFPFSPRCRAPDCVLGRELEQVGHVNAPGDGVICSICML